MPRSSPTRPSRRADGRSESSEHGGIISKAGGGEEKCTTVAIRIRPLNDREKAGKQNRIWRCVPTHNSITQTSPDGNPLPDTKGNTFFTYDRIFDEDSTTQEVYEGVARDIVHSVVRGLNGTIFAYGQTSSGKTFTMQGGDAHETPGIVQLAARDLFQQMEEAPDRMFLMRVSYLEIYQEDIKDLLNPESSKLQVREDPRKGVYIEAHEKVVSDFDNVLKILNAGEKQRHVGCTEMNNRSSRSHTIFRLVVESQEHYVPGIHASPEEVDPAVLVATLNLVDLAGSESVRHTGATGMRQKEGGKINQSLLTLSRVIQTLSQGGSAHVNYRDSKLTRMLQPSLSGNAGMAIICCATPAEGYLEETRSTLQFASRAKQIKTCAMVNEVLDDKAQLRRVSRELAALKRQQAEGESGSALVETLQAEKAEQAAKIERLKNLLINLTPVDEERELHLAASPRYRRTKRSRETWCPGEGGVPLPLSLLDGNNSSTSGMNIRDLEKARKRRSNASVDTPTSKGSAEMKSPQTPLVSREDGNTTAPGLMSPARARSQQDVHIMREKLSALQAERDSKAAAAEIETRRVKQLEAVVTEREQEVLSLKEQLDAASKAAAGERVEAITAQLAEATKAKYALEQELNEFSEYTDLKDQETTELKEKMAAMNEILQHKETELSAIRAAEEEKTINASRVQELENQVEELEAAIEDRGQAIAEMEASGPGVAKEEDELAGLKVALEACQKELAKHQTRADGAEAELKELIEELSSTKARLDEERDSAERAAQEAANAVEAASAAAEAASRREREVTSESQERISALEAERASLQEQEAELRVRNADAAEQLTVQEALLTSVAKDDTAQKAVADAQEEVEKRDCLLAGLQGRVGELEGNLAEAMKEKQELTIRIREEKLKAQESLTQALEGQRRAEDALNTANDSRDELRFRLEEATLQAQDAEAARESMANAGTTIKLKEEEISALEEQVSEGIDRLHASEEAVIAAKNLAGEARSQLADSKASCELKDAKIDELTALVKRLEADGDKSAQLEEDWEILHGKHEMVLSEKQKLEEELAVACMDAEELGAKVQALSDNDRCVEVLSAELSAAKASASEAQALSSAEISRLAKEVTTSKDQTTTVQSQLEAKTQEVLTLRADAEDLRVRLSAVEEAATEREVASDSRTALAEDRLTEALAAAEKMATEAMEAKQKAVTVDDLVSELEDVRKALEAREMEIADIASKHEVEVERIRVALERAEASAMAKEKEVTSLRQQAACEVSEVKSKADGLASELESVHEVLEAREKEMANVVSKREAETSEIRAVLERAEALVTAKEEEIANLKQEAAHEVSESQARANGLASELESVRETLETACVASKHEATTEDISALERAKTLVIAKEEEIAGIKQQASGDVAEAQAKADSLESELETVREALDAKEMEIANVASKLEAETRNMREALERAEASAVSKGEEVTSLGEQAADRLQGALAKQERLVLELETTREALEASEKEMANLAKKDETETEKIRSELERAEALAMVKEEEACQEKAKAEDLASELETVRKALEVGKEEAACIASRHESVMEGMRAALERAEALVAVKEEEVFEVQAKVDGLASELETVHEALEVSKKEAACVTSKYEATTEDIRSALQRAEKLATAKEAEICEAQAKADRLVSELETVREALEVSNEEAASVSSKHEGVIEHMRAALERAEALMAVKKEEVCEVQAKAGGLASELETVREALEVSKKEVASKYEATTEDIRSALQRAEKLATAKEVEVGEAQAKADRLVLELETVREALEVSNEEAASLASKHEGVTGEMHAALERAEALLMAKEEEVASHHQQALDELQEAQAKVDSLSSELEAAREALEASEEEAASVAAKHEVETSEIRAVLERAEALAIAKEEEVASLRQQATQQLCEAKDKADGFASELETVRDALEVYEKEMVEVASKHEAETEDIRAALERAKAFATAKEEEVAGLLQQNADDLRKAQTTVDAANASVSTKDDVIAELNKRLESNEAVEIDLAQALRDSEDLSKQVLDLTDQVVEKERTMAELRQELDSVSSDLTALKEQRTSFAADNSNASIADTKAELRRLKVELDMKGSEMDTLLKENVRVHAELKEMKGMFNAAEAGAGAAGVDEASLRKRISQLQCQNGLLRGEKDRLEVLSTAAAAEAKNSAARAAAKIERFERDISGLKEREETVSAARENGDRASMALKAMEAKLSELRKERLDLQAAGQRSLDRCSAAEREVETLRTRVVEMERRDDSRGTVAALETRVDQLEEELRCTESSKADMEGAVHEKANRVKRLQREVEMMRSEYEIVSEEVSGLRERLAATESKATEEQELRQRLSDQVAGAENLQKELEASRGRCEEAEAAVRAAEGCAGDGVDSNTKELLSEMENLYQEKLLADSRVDDMQAEIEKLRMEVTSAAKLAAEEQHAIIAASKQKIENIEEEAFAAKEEALDELQKSQQTAAALKGKVEDLHEEKLLADNRADDMQEEIEKLRMEVASSAKLAAKEQHAIIAASKLKIKTLEEAFAAKEEALDELQALLDSALDTAAADKSAFKDKIKDLHEEKLLADSRVSEMHAEIEKLRMGAESAANLAAEEQHAIFAASKQKIKTLEEAFVAKEEALDELQASLDEPRDTAAADTSALNRKIREFEELIEQKNARITRLESVRLTKDQVEKLSVMKLNARLTTAENKKLKQRLAELERRMLGGVAQDSALVVANERVEELQGVKSSLMERCQQYGERIYELERQQMRVRAAVEKAGVVAPEGCDLSDAVLEVAERAAGADDASVVSSISTSEAAAVASAVAASERNQAELKEAKAALQKETAERLTVQEQMRAGVLKYRVLEANVSAMQQQLTAAEMGKREAVKAAVKTKERDHEHELKFLQKENLTLYQENASVKAEADKCKAELKALMSKLLAPSQADKAPASAKKERVCADKTNVPIKTSVTSARKSTPAKPQHTTAAERRAHSRALLEEKPSTAEEEVGECKQS